MFSTSRHSSISFLDTLVSLDNKDNISTNLYRKSTAGNSIVRANSAHPELLKCSIPFAQYLRLRRICSSTEDFKLQARALHGRLLKRGYSRSLHKKSFHAAITHERHDLLYKEKKPCGGNSTSFEPTRCILTYSQQHKKISDILAKYWPILTEDPNYVSVRPSNTYQRCTSLKDTLTSSHF